MHQPTAFDSDLFRNMVSAELDRCVSRSKAKNVLDPTEPFSLELLEDELQGLAEKLDEAERKIQLLGAKREAQPRSSESGWRKVRRSVYRVSSCFISYK